MRASKAAGWAVANRRKVGMVILLRIIVVGLAVAPYLTWARIPSLVDDDLTRVGGFRRFAPPASLFRPFNEHLAPLFELVGWGAWRGSGQRVESIAAGFLVASYLAWGCTLVALSAWIWLELGSGLMVLVALTWFALSSVPAETVLWYSASSFQWAAAATLAALVCALRGVRSSPASGRQWWWLGAAALCSAAGPMFSAIGVLAGPFAALRVLVGDSNRANHARSGRSRLRCAVVPLVGTLSYAILIVANSYHGAAVSASLRRTLDPAAAARAMLIAPSMVLVPSLVGAPSLAGWLPEGIAASCTLGFCGGALVWAWRGGDRGLLLLDLGWVIGGYLLAYGARAQTGDRFILEVGRYHLFPLIGVICWATAAVHPLVRALEVRRPIAGLAALVALTSIGFVWQRAKIDEVARRSFRFPEQERAIAAAGRLEAICQTEQIPLAQAIRIIDPTEPRWFARPLPFNPLLYLFGPGPESLRRDDGAARSLLIDRLSMGDREVIFGGLDAARYRGGAMDIPSNSTVLHLKPGGIGKSVPPGEGQLYHVEFDVPIHRGEVTWLDVAGISPGVRLEVWWAAQGEDWSAGRSVRWLASRESHPMQLARLPHWRPGSVRRYRVVRRGRPLLPADRPVLDLTIVPD